MINSLEIRLICHAVSMVPNVRVSDLRPNFRFPA